MHKLNNVPHQLENPCHVDISPELKYSTRSRSASTGLKLKPVKTGSELLQQIAGLSDTAR